jgi:hypothetical protein
MKNKFMIYLIIIVVTILIICGAFVYLGNILGWNNNGDYQKDMMIKNSLLENKIAELENKLKDDNKAMERSTSSTPNIKVTTKSNVNTSVNKKTTVVSPVEDKQIVKPSYIEVVQDNTPSLVVEEPNLMQTIYPGYGGYEIRLRVTAKGDDFYIPMTTTDSTKGLTGISYSIKGGEFKGIQSSKVNCSTSKKNIPFEGNQYCFIANGTSLDVTATIWLNNTSFGNYSVLFNKLGYLRENDKRMLYYILNKETETLYLN